MNRGDCPVRGGINGQGCDRMGRVGAPRIRKDEMHRIIIVTEIITADTYIYGWGHLLHSTQVLLCSLGGLDDRSVAGAVTEDVRRGI